MIQKEKQLGAIQIKEVIKLNLLQEVDVENDWWDTIPDKIKTDIDAALMESDNGDFIPHEEIKKRMQKHPL